MTVFPEKTDKNYRFLNRGNMLNLILKKDRGDASCIDITKLPIFAKCEDVYCGSVVLIEGVTYIIYSVIEKHEIGFIEPIRLNLEATQLYNDFYIKCPVCEYEDDALYYSDSDEEHSCKRCGSILSYTTEVIRSFSVDVVKQCELKRIK